MTLTILSLIPPSPLYSLNLVHTWGHCHMFVYKIINSMEFDHILKQNFDKYLFNITTCIVSKICRLTWYLIVNIIWLALYIDMVLKFVWYFFTKFKVFFCFLIAFTQTCARVQSFPLYCAWTSQWLTFEMKHPRIYYG